MYYSENLYSGREIIIFICLQVAKDVQLTFIFCGDSVYFYYNAISKFAVSVFLRLIFYLDYVN